jgi:hypothetical protein
VTCQKPTQVTLVGVGFRQVGVDPWNEMLDDGGKNLVDVPGACPPTSE